MGCINAAITKNLETKTHYVDRKKNELREAKRNMSLEEDIPLSCLQSYMGKPFQDLGFIRYIYNIY